MESCWLKKFSLKNWLQVGLQMSKGSLKLLETNFDWKAFILALFIRSTLLIRIIRLLPESNPNFHIAIGNRNTFNISSYREVSSQWISKWMSWNSTSVISLYIFPFNSMHSYGFLFLKENLVRAKKNMDKWVYCFTLSDCFLKSKKLIRITQAYGLYCYSYNFVQCWSGTFLSVCGGLCGMVGIPTSSTF